MNSLQIAFLVLMSVLVVGAFIYVKLGGPLGPRNIDEDERFNHGDGL